MKSISEFKALICQLNTEGFYIPNVDDIITGKLEKMISAANVHQIKNIPSSDLCVKGEQLNSFDVFTEYLTGFFKRFSQQDHINELVNQIPFKINFHGDAVAISLKYGVMPSGDRGRYVVLDGQHIKLNYLRERQLIFTLSDLLTVLYGQTITPQMFYQNVWVATDEVIDLPIGIRLKYYKNGSLELLPVDKKANPLQRFQEAILTAKQNSPEWCLVNFPQPQTRSDGTPTRQQFDRTEPCVLVKDGEPVWMGPFFECEHFLRLEQPYSVDWALTEEGYQYLHPHQVANVEERLMGLYDAKLHWATKRYINIPEIVFERLQAKYKGNPAYDFYKAKETRIRPYLGGFHQHSNIVHNS